MPIIRKAAVAALLFITLISAAPAAFAQTQAPSPPDAADTVASPDRSPATVEIEVDEPDGPPAAAEHVQPEMRLSRPDRTPGILLGAALLALPADKDLFKSVRRAAGTDENDFYRTANMLGDGKVLIPLLGGMYLLGNRGDKDTATLAFAALVNTGLATEGLKRLTGRARPDMDDGGDFHGPRVSSGYTSFPSGHTGAAFAVATVLAKRHPKQRWIYYGLASAVGLARVQKGAHFPADVLAGAGIGIYVGNWTVKHGPRLITFRW